MFLAFIDVEKIYDAGNRKALWEVLTIWWARKTSEHC